MTTKDERDKGTCILPPQMDSLRDSGPAQNGSETSLRHDHAIGYDGRPPTFIPQAKEKHNMLAACYLPPVLTTKQLADALQVHPRTVRRLAKNGMMPQPKK